VLVFDLDALLTFAPRNVQPKAKKRARRTA